MYIKKSFFKNFSLLIATNMIPIMFYDFDFQQLFFDGPSAVNKEESYNSVLVNICFFLLTNVNPVIFNNNCKYACCFNC